MEKNRPGFTLIELLVVISIMLIFIGGTIAQYNTNTQQTKLKNEGGKLVDVLELAKKKALSADLVGSCSDFTGYQVKTYIRTYSLKFCCDSTCSVVQNYNLTANNIITTGANGDYNFSPLMNNPSFSNDTIVIKNSIINKCVNVSISKVGIIYLDETLAGC